MTIILLCGTTSSLEEILVNEEEVECARQTGGPVGEPVAEQTEEFAPIKENISMILVGQDARDFIALVYH